jgi:hypothetical protein
MRRWITHLFIAGYLGSLATGIAAQTMKFGNIAHPVAYFFVWDMFCGWSTFEARYHLIAEGESGTYYWLSPPPWGEFRPYGDLARHHYDYYGNGLLRMAMNTLRHTDHEPIERILFVEECWPKKYNLPDELWALRCAEPKEPMSYFWLRNVFTADGTPLESRMDFLHQLYADAVLKNPRLHADSMRGAPMFVINPADRRPGAAPSFLDDTALRPVEALPNAN